MFPNPFVLNLNLGNKCNRHILSGVSKEIKIPNTEPSLEEEKITEKKSLKMDFFFNKHF